MDIDHPSRDILGKESRALEGRRIILGVTGSVACYRSVDLARKLMRRGAEVTVVMSRDASELISPKTFHWATGNPVITEITGEIEHVKLASAADSMVIAPATANTVSKVAHGVADTPVTLTAMAVMGAGKPLAIVPAMHAQLYRSPQMAESLDRLRGMGCHVLEPVLEEGKAKLPGIEDVAHFVEAVTLRGRDLEGLRVLVTAGPTREYLDPVRFLSNPSSGRMGVAVAREAYFRGAEVTLIHGPLSIEAPPWIEGVGVETTKEYLGEVLRALERGFDVAILAAAPIDYRFSVRAGSKIESAGGPIEVRLELTPKVVEEVRRRYPSLLLVGFAAETVGSDEELLERAYEKLNRYSLDMIVANNVGRRDIGFVSPMNEVYILDREGRRIHVPKKSKWEVAREILDAVKMLLRGSG